MPSEIISRQDAKALGLKRYYTGEPCGRMHDDDRQVSSGQCMTCNRLNQGEYYSTPHGKSASAARRQRRMAKPEYRERESARHARKRAKPGYRERENKASSARRKALSPDQRRTLLLKKKYNLTLSQFKVKLAAQENACAICRTDFAALRPSLWLTPIKIDHCHKSNRIRGLLCHHCNVALGSFRDSPALLRAAAIYLEKYQLKT